MALPSPDVVAAPPKKGAAPAPSKEELAKKEAADLGANAYRLKVAKQYAAALVEGKKALSIVEKVDPEGGTMKSVLLTLAETCKAMGDHACAVVYYDRRLAVVEKRPSNDADVLFRIEEAAKAHNENGDYERAIALCERALPIATARDGQKEGDHVATVVAIIAQSQKGLRRWADAEASFLRVIGIYDKIGRHGVHWDLLNLADMYRERGWYTRAEPLLERAFELATQESRAHGWHVMSKLVVNRVALEDYRGAEVLVDEFTAIAASSGEDSLSFATMLAIRGELDVQSGAYDHAGPALERAAAIVQKHEAKGDEEATSLGAALNGVKGRLETAEGDFSRAEASLEKARVFFEKNGKPKEKAEIYEAFAELYQKAQRFERAETYAAKALAIRDAEPWEAHPSKAESRAILGRIREARGDAAGARKLHAEALAIREAAFGNEHPIAARSRLDLADLSRRQGRFGEAEPEYKRAIAIFEKSFGSDHETVAACLEGLSSLYASTGKLDLAVRTAERAAAIRERQAALVIAGGSEAQKRGLLATMRGGSDWVASLHARVAPADERARRLALTTILQRKGRVLDVMASSLAALRQRLLPKDAALFDELSAARADVAKLAMRGPAGEPLDSFRRDLAAREAKARAIEEKLGNENGELRAEQLPVTIERVQALVPEGAAMVELSTYTPRRSSDAVMSSRESTGAPRISAYVLDAAGRVSFVDLGESAPIEAATSSLRAALSSPSTQDPKPVAQTLFSLTMQKILPLVPGKTRLLVSADGALSLVPFAALVDEAGKYLVERYEITYLTSGRDLLRLARRSPSGSGALVVANPAFGPRASGESALSLLDEPSGSAEKNRGLDKAYFDPLPATAGEARAIAALMPRAEVRVDVEATEALLKKSRAPRLLHVATHGFFLSAKRPPATPPPSDKERGLELDRVTSPDWLPDDPLLRSGLALTGANSKNGGGGEDGILTALEASSLDLWGTKLVVLSACETGLGDVQRGEGVYGLRRALFMAGAETLVASLWKVADEETKSLMIGYYDRVLKGTARGAALREVQLSMLATPATAHPYYWASFGVFGDPSPLGAESAGEPETSPKVAKGSVGGTIVKIAPSVRGCACRMAEPEEGMPAFSGALLLGLLGGVWFRRNAGRNGDKVGPR